MRTTCRHSETSADLRKWQLIGLEQQTGRILVEWIPVYYDAPRMLRINGLDDQPKNVLVHAGKAEAAGDAFSRMDEKLRTSIIDGRPFDLGVGRYDVSVATVALHVRAEPQSDVGVAASLATELTFVTRHGCEPWTALAVKLMLKWPGLHYSTSAFAPKHYPADIINYANTRGADKIIYAGYFPMGLSLERIMTDMPKVGFKDEVWPKFLRGNAARVLKLDV